MADFTDEDDALLAELGVEAPARPSAALTAVQERVLAGFEDIQRFVDEHGRAPQHGEDRDIFERLYAVRLDRLRLLTEHHELLRPLDRQSLLGGQVQAEEADLDDDALLAELDAGDLTRLEHVRPSADRRPPDEIAARTTCTDFAAFAPLFEQMRADLAAQRRETRRFERKSEIEPGRFYILGGQMLMVAATEAPFTDPHGNVNARLRVIYDNGTESNLLLRTLQRSLQQDPTGRRIVQADAGPLFADTADEADPTSGTIYVLRSLSDHPAIAPHRNLLHKIGVTSGDVQRRISQARRDPTFLMADVEVVASYDLYGIRQSRLEALIHRIFGAARLDADVTDRFGTPVNPREWFLVPLPVIDEAVTLIRDGKASGAVYDPQSASITTQSG